jgi:hypothetical protein
LAVTQNPANGIELSLRPMIASIFLSGARVKAPTSARLLRPNDARPEDEPSRAKTFAIP